MPATHVAHVYGSLALFQSILHNVFLLYHVETFVSIYKIDRTSFWLAEAVFLIWNSVNDPLFGWFSDRHYLEQVSSIRPCEVIVRRLTSLRLYGPLLALSFLLFWMDWAPAWLQLATCLCLYDTCLTMVDLHYQVLLADLSISSHSRTRLNFYTSVYSALGASSVFLSHLFWRKDHFSTFQLYCLTLTVCSVAGYLMATRHLLNCYREKSRSSTALHLLLNNSETDGIKTQAAKLFRYLKEVRGHKNFIWFACMNLIQVFHCHFNSNFFPLFIDSLLGGEISASITSILLGVSFVAPHINNIYFLSLCRRFGVYVVIQGLFLLKFFLALLMLYLGASHTWILALFIASNRIFTEGTCRLLVLVVTDLVDEDYVIHRRKQAVSALMFGTAALLSKPGQTLAPVIGTMILALHTGHDVFESGSIKQGPGLKDDDAGHQEACFNMLVFVPMTCALVQLALWSNFTLRGHWLTRVKELRAGRLRHENI